MKKILLAVCVAALVAVAGCGGNGGSDQAGIDRGIDIDDNSAGAANVTHGIGVEVGGMIAGSGLTEITATYPEGQFVVGSAQPDEIVIRIDADGDSESERTINGSQITSVDTADNSFTLTLDSDDTLQSGYIVLVEYPAITNPDEPGEYTVEVRLNGRQTSEVTAVIE
jgi:hypothetical protein